MKGWIIVLLQKRPLLFIFPYVCPEPVLANYDIRLLVQNGAAKMFAHHSRESTYVLFLASGGRGGAFPPRPAVSHAANSSGGSHFSMIVPPAEQRFSSFKTFPVCPEPVLVYH
jgi:hypothetical protein